MLCPICHFDTPPDLQNCRACGAALGAVANAKGEVQSDTLPQGTLLLGTYAVENLLGQGGFGITYKCHDLMLDRRVAVKEFFPAGSRRQGDKVCPAPNSSEVDFREARAQFLAEARLLARCHHAGIVSVHAAFEANETAYMVMELLHGQSLGQLLEVRGGRLSEDDAVVYIERTGEALQFVHDLGLLHRDIKPENIIVCDDGRVMLIDFGTAREFSKGQSQGHTIIVTPGYAPLEQYARQAQRGAFTDVYSLAATLYHLLTGHVPPAASDRAMGVLVPPVRQENRPISRSVAYAVEMGLQMEVAKRPQSVREFLELLNAPVEDKGFDPITLKSLDDQSRPLKAPALGKPLAPYPGSDQARQQLLEMVDTLLPASPQPVQLDPQTAFVGGTTPSHSPSPVQNVVPLPVPSAASITPSTASGGVIHKDSSDLGGWDNIYWWLLAIVVGTIGLSVLLSQPGLKRSVSPNYSTSQSPPQSFSPPSSTFSRPNTNRAVEEATPAILPTSTQLLPGSSDTTAAYNNVAAYTLINEAATFSSDGQRLAYMDGQAAVRVWDIKERRVVQTLPQDVKHPPVGLLFSRDGKTLLLTYQEQGQDKRKINNQIRAYDLVTGKPQRSLLVDPTKEWMWPQAALPDGQFIVVKGQLRGVGTPVPSSSVFRWNPYNGKQSVMPIPKSKNTDFIRAVVSPDGQEIVTGDARGSIRWWHTNSGVQKAQRETRMSYADFQSSPLFASDIPGNADLNSPLPVEALRFSPTGSWLASRNKAQIRIFNTQAQEVSTLSIGYSPRFAISPDGQFLVEGGDWKNPEEVWLWNVRQNQKTKLASSAGRINDLTFSPDGQQVRAVNIEGGRIRLLTWQVDAKPLSVFKKRKSWTFQTDQILFSRAVTLSQSSGLLAFPAHTRIEIRQQDGTLVKRLNAGNFDIQGASFSPADQFLAAWSDYSTLQLWNVQTGQLVTMLGAPRDTKVEDKALPTQPRKRSSPYERDNFRTMTFSPDGNLLAYAKSDGNSPIVEWWSIKDKPRLLGSLTPKEPVTALAFSSDNQSLVCGTKSGGVQWYKLATQKLQAQAQTGETVVNITVTPQNLIVVGNSQTRSYALPTKRQTSPQSLQQVGQVDALLLPNGARIPFAMRANAGWAISSNGQFLASPHGGGKVWIWYLPTGSLLQSLEDSQGGMFFNKNLAFSADGTQLTTVAQDMSSRLITVTNWSRAQTQ